MPEPPLLPPSRDPCSHRVTSPTADTISSFPPLNSLKTGFTLLRLLQRVPPVFFTAVRGRVGTCADAGTTALVAAVWLVSSGGRLREKLRSSPL